MTAIQPPYALQALDNHPAVLFRRVIQALAPREGIASFNGADDLKVAAGTGLDVTVARGGALIKGDDTTDQGLYFVYNDGSVTLTHDAGGTQPRKDLVVARVKDNTEGQAGDTWALEIIKGTEDPAPVEPSLPATALKLAVVDIAASASSVGTITDSRQRIGTDVDPPEQAQIVTGQTTTSTTYADLATVGPDVVIDVPSSGRVLVTIACGISNSNTSASESTRAAFALSGANSRSASDEDSVAAHNSILNGTIRLERTTLLENLTPGSTTFRMKYRVSAGTGTFANRRILVEPLP